MHFYINELPVKYDYLSFHCFDGQLNKNLGSNLFFFWEFKGKGPHIPILEDAGIGM